MKLKEKFERIGLALRLIWSSDSELVRYVRREAALADPSMVQHLTDVARAFSLYGHSGGSAPVVISWLSTLLSWQPVTPLTGNDDEWTLVTDDLYQNKRCSRVFKEAGGMAYDIDGIAWTEKDGFRQTGRKFIKFPYWPVTEERDVE